MAYHICLNKFIRKADCRWHVLKYLPFFLPVAFHGNMGRGRKKKWKTKLSLLYYPELKCTKIIFKPVSSIPPWCHANYISNNFCLHKFCFLLLREPFSHNNNKKVDMNAKNQVVDLGTVPVEIEYLLGLQGKDYRVRPSLDLQLRST